MRRPSRILAATLVALLLGVLAAPLFAQASAGYCVVRFQHDVKGKNVWQGGTAYIDFGVGNLRTVQYESMAAMLNAMSDWGWELVTGFPLLQDRVSLLVFRKK